MGERTSNRPIHARINVRGKLSQIVGNILSRLRNLNFTAVCDPLRYKLRFILYSFAGS